MTDWSDQSVHVFDPATGAELTKLLAPGPRDSQQTYVGEMSWAPLPAASPTQTLYIVQGAAHETCLPCMSMTLRLRLRCIVSLAGNFDLSVGGRVLRYDITQQEGAAPSNYSVRELVPWTPLLRRPVGLLVAQLPNKVWSVSLQAPLPLVQDQAASAFDAVEPAAAASPTAAGGSQPTRLERRSRHEVDRRRN